VLRASLSELRQILANVNCGWGREQFGPPAGLCADLPPTGDRNGPSLPIAPEVVGDLAPLTSNIYRNPSADPQA